MSEAVKRRRKLRELVARRSIATQAELVRALRAEGIECTQASVSRDIAALGLSKRGGFYVLPLAAAPGGFDRRTAGRILSIRNAGENLLVLQTLPGEAAIVAINIDAARWPFVAGTVAGDDTLFVACDGREALEKTREALREWLSAPL